MALGQKSSPITWNLLGAICFIVLLGIFAAHNFVGEYGPGVKANAIINNLRYIDAAKQQWALEHGITNANQMLQFNQALSWKDIAPYLLQDINVIQSKHFNSNGEPSPVSGEIYTINSPDKAPEAKLTHDVGFLSKGTIIPDFNKVYIYLDQATNH